MEDAAMFYEELSQHGEWVEYENYGPVWHPRGVEEDWRPYTNGRWVPTSQGYVFESHEPWAWATYHYGNWFPTPHYGWCWAPGRTWYPNTVTWRTSPQTAAVDVSYIGWAPIPPPSYVPPPGYYPPGGYAPGAPVVDLITAPFWIFAKAAQFLLGFGQPYVPSYSYYGCGCLAPPTYVPVLYPRTVFLTNYVANPFYPRAYFAFGPPIPYVSRVTRIQQVTINNYIKTVNVTRIVNVTPPAAVINRNVAIRQITPKALAEGRPLPRVKPAAGVTLAQAARPNVAPIPKEVPRITKPIPKAAPLPAKPPERVRGMGLPSGAAHQVTPKMQKEIQKAPPPAAKMPPTPREMKPGAPPVAPKAPPAVKPGPPPAVPPAVKPGPPAVKPGPPAAVPPKAAPPPVKPTPPPTVPPKAAPPAMKPGPPAMKPGPPATVPPTRPPAVKPGPPAAVTHKAPPAMKPGPPPAQVRPPAMQPKPSPRMAPAPKPPAEVQKPRPQPQPQVRPQAPMKPQQPPRAPAPQQPKPQQLKQQKQPQQPQ
jgi:hypothetical protein